MRPRHARKYVRSADGVAASGDENETDSGLMPVGAEAAAPKVKGALLEGLRAAGGLAEGVNEKGAVAAPLVLAGGAPKDGTAGVIAEAGVGLKPKPPNAGGGAGAEVLVAGLGAASAANGLPAGAPKGEPVPAGAPKPPKMGAAWRVHQSSVLAKINKNVQVCGAREGEMGEPTGAVGVAFWGVLPGVLR